MAFLSVEKFTAGLETVSVQRL